MKVGDTVRLVSQHSTLNGWSVKKELDGVLVVITEIEDRPNGMITAEHQGQKIAFFRDAVSYVAKKPTHA